MTAAELLRAIGEVLYGADWRRPLQAKLGVGERPFRRWAGGSTEPPPGVWLELHREANRLARLLSNGEKGDAG